MSLRSTSADGHRDFKHSTTFNIKGDFVQPTDGQFHNARWPWPAKTTSRSSKILRPVLVVLLFSVAVTLTILIPGPWSLVYNQASESSMSAPKITVKDPASEWKDDVWPFRPQSPWDISTDFPYPRILEYDVDEGTWLRLDVHPRSGDIVFDMLGDLYCLPAKAYRIASHGMNQAYPILLGVPHDSDPHFSPNGDSIVFRSDAELGVENIWVMEWKGCEAMNVRPTIENAPEDLKDAMQSKNTEEDMLATGIKESRDRKRKRLLREGRLGGM
jgi:hypothetical protein